MAELATQFFITNDRPNVAGLVLAGSADFKTELSQSDMFDPRLQAVVLGVVDVSYGALPARCWRAGGQAAGRRAVLRGWRSASAAAPQTLGSGALHARCTRGDYQFPAYPVV